MRKEKEMIKKKKIKQGIYTKILDHSKKMN